MKKSVLIAISLISFPVLFAQNCLHTIPSSAVPVDTDGVNIQDGDILWLCEGVTYEFVGESTTAYIEKDCDITVTGDNQSAIYMKAPGSLTIDGDNGYYLLDSAVAYADNGSGNTIDICYMATNQALEFDYSTAPVMLDCIDTGSVGIKVITAAPGSSIYPNPATDIVNVRINSNDGLVNFALYSTSGQLLQSGSLNGPLGEIDISSLEPGLYFLELVGRNGRKTESISVQ